DGAAGGEGQDLGPDGRIQPLVFLNHSRRDADHHAHALHRGTPQTSTSALITPAAGSVSPAKRFDTSESDMRWVIRASGTSPARMASMTRSKSLTVALRLPSSEVSRLWNSGSEKLMSLATMETRT